MTNTESFDVAALVSYMQEEMGINPFTIYCQLTGKPIGRIDADELAPFFKGDIDEVADDLFVRIIASMRPSIHWNVMRESSLADLAKSRPIETLAYLLNRLFQANDHHKLPTAARLDDQHNRIRMFQFLTDLAIESRDELFTLLIEVDAKMNLSQQTIDLRPADFMLFFTESLEVIRKFHADCMKRWLRNQKAEEDSRRWYKGNTMARPAFFQSWMESKPETKTAAKQRVKREADKELLDLFDSVMEEAAKPVESKPLPLPVEPAKSEPAPATVTRKIPAFLIKKAK